MAAELPPFTVCIYRPTQDVDRMIRFLEVLGLHETVHRDVDGAAFVWGRGGMVALFPAEGQARPGRGELTLETPDLTAAKDALDVAGLPSTLIADDNFPGLSVVAPDGRSMWIAESFRDPDDRGEDYEHHAIDVLALHHSTQTDLAIGFFELFGFHLEARGDNLWTIMFRDEQSGAIALEGRAGVPEQGPIMVQLGLRTEEPLSEVAARLGAAGFPVGELTEMGGFPFLAVHDPDDVTIGLFQVASDIP